PIEHWVRWLPEDVVSKQFVTLEPILRDERAIESKVWQIVEAERRVRAWRTELEQHQRDAGEVGYQRALNAYFPQNEQSCHAYGRRCWAWELCWGDAGQNPREHGFRPREANHPIEEGE